MSEMSRDLTMAITVTRNIVVVGLVRVVSLLVRLRVHALASERAVRVGPAGRVGAHAAKAATMPAIHRIDAGMFHGGIHCSGESMSININSNIQGPQGRPRDPDRKKKWRKRKQMEKALKQSLADGGKPASTDGTDGSSGGSSDE